MKKYFFTLFLFFYSLLATASNNNFRSDSIRISLITCAPGEDIYSLFGHTAIRVTIPDQNYDIAYNYGIFDFNSENFIWRFSLGQTDYLLGKYPFEYFLGEYIASHRAVWEQELDLSFDEKITLINDLETNYLPENRVYRYNFLYDNCATRPLNKINDIKAGSIELIETDNTPYSFRDLIHRYTKGHPWSEFGMDLCLGSKADKIVGIEEKIFVPIELMQAIDGANTKTGVITKPIANLYEPDSSATTENSIWNIITPLTLFTSVALVLAIICYREYKRRKTFWGIDAILFPIYGVAGCILAFLSFFSEHPAVSPNYILFLFHPFHLIFAPYIIRGEIKRTKIWYHYLNGMVLTLFLVFLPLIPQNFNFAVVPLAICLLLRSVTYILIERKNKL